uniref:YkvI family membrane protein n=1 Tax=uncultured Actinomyces sp. TaxID=249061 RepID=UPI0025F5C1C7
MPKQYLSVAFAYVGVVIGAGLASGQDLLQYFLSFGAKGLIGIAVLGVLNIVFGVVALQLGSYYRSGHHDEVFERIAPPLVRRVIDVVLVFSGFAMGVVMLSGAGANLEQQFGIPAWAGSAICAVLVVVTAFLDFDRIMKVIGVFTPMIIVAISILTIYSLARPHPGITELNAAAQNVTPALPNLWLSTINYFALCVVNGIAMAFVLGGSVLRIGEARPAGGNGGEQPRIGEARRAGRIGGTIIALVIGADALCLYLNMDRVWDVNVPALEIARSIHPAFAFVYTLIIFALIYNTVFSLFYSTARRFSDGQTTRMRIVLVGVVAVGYAASLMGFKKLIGGMYPIIGWLGVALLVVLAVGWLRERSAVLREENLRRKLIRVLVRKHADDLEYTDEHRAQARTLAQASV